MEVSVCSGGLLGNSGTTTHTHTFTFPVHSHITTIINSHTATHCHQKESRVGGQQQHTTCHLPRHHPQTWRSRVKSSVSFSSCVLVVLPVALWLADSCFLLFFWGVLWCCCLGCPVPVASRPLSYVCSCCCCCSCLVSVFLFVFSLSMMTWWRHHTGGCCCVSHIVVMLSVCGFLFHCTMIIAF